MSETENKDTYAKMIKENFELLNNNDKFKEKIKEDQFKILINPKDEKHAALVTVDKGTIKVEKIINNLYCFELTLRVDLPLLNDYISCSRLLSQGENARDHN